MIQSDPLHQKPALADDVPPGRGRRLAIIHNPVAGARRNGFFQSVVRRAQALGCKVDIKETSAPGDATWLARNISRDQADIIVVAGGDGTMNEVINGLSVESPPLALIPTGTANVLAIEIGLRRNVEQVAATLAWGLPRPFFPIQVEDRLCAMAVGIGYDAHIVANINPRLKRAVGKGAYIWQAIVEFTRFPFKPLTVATKDGVAVDATSVLIANGRHYAGRFCFAPDASINRPEFFVCILPGRRRWDLLRYIAALGAGRLHRLRDVSLSPCDEVTINLSAGEPLEIDGDPVSGPTAALALRIRSADHAFDLIYPDAPDIP